MPSSVSKKSGNLVLYLICSKCGARNFLTNGNGGKNIEGKLSERPGKQEIALDPGLLRCEQQKSNLSKSFSI